MSPPHKSEKTEGVIALSESSIIRTNLGFILSAVGLAAVGVLGWATMRGDVEAIAKEQAHHVKELAAIDTTHTARMSVLEADWRQVREVLVRIDERTEQIRREQIELKERMRPAGSTGRD